MADAVRHADAELHDQLETDAAVEIETTMVKREEEKTSVFLIFDLIY